MATRHDCRLSAFLSISAVLGLVGPSYGQQWPTSFISERVPCASDTGRAVWFDAIDTFSVGGGLGHWFYTQNSFQTPPERISVDDATGSFNCAALFSRSGQIKFGSLDFDPTNQRLWGGGLAGTYNGVVADYQYFFLPVGTGQTWVSAFTTQSFPTTMTRDDQPANSAGVAVDANGSLWLSSYGGFNIHHVALNGSTWERQSDSFVVPFPNTGVEVVDGFLLLASVSQQRINVYSKSGATRYPLGYFSALNTQDHTTRTPEDLDLRVEGGQTILSVHAESSPNRLVQFDVTSMVTDVDGDGIPAPASPAATVPFASDNCPGVANSNQQDSNGDGKGDGCQIADGNADGDARADYLDNCVNVFNSGQEDTDADGIGDACDPLTLCMTSEQVIAAQNSVADMVLADLDNDGDDEVITLHNKSYSGLGSTRVAAIVSVRWSGTHGAIGRLSEPVEYPVGENAVSGSAKHAMTSMVVGDFNHDGFRDIAVVLKPETSNIPIIPAAVTILYGDANHFFGAVGRFELSASQYAGPQSLAAADLDGIAGEELVVPNNESGANSIIIVRPLAASGSQVQSFALSYAPGLAILVRVNSDPYPDLVVAAGAQSIHVHLGMAAPPYFETNWTAYYSIVDPLQIVAVHLRSATQFFDLAIRGDQPSLPVFMLHDSAEGFADPVEQDLSNGTSPHLHRMARIPANLCPNCPSGLDGLAAVQQQTDSAGYGTSWKLSVFPPKNVVGISPIDSSARTDWNLSSGSSGYVAGCGSLDRTTNVDCATQDTGGPVGGTTTLSVFRNAIGAPGAISAFNRPVLSTPVQVLAADVDNANGKDLIVLNLGGSAAGDKVQVFRQNPAFPNRFPFAADEQLGPSTAQFISVALAGDLNGDGKPDLIATYRNGGDVYVNSYLRHADGTVFDPGPTPQVLPVDFGTNCGCSGCASSTSVSGVVVADFNVDGKPDALVSARTGTRQLFAVVGSGGGAFQPCPQLLFSGTQVFATPISGVLTPMAARDLDCDGKPELIGASNTTPQAVRILKNISTPGGSPQFSSIFTDLSLPAGANPIDIRSIALGTFPAAAGPFIAVADFANDRVVVFLSTGPSSYSAVPYSLAAAAAPDSVVVMDLDGDGDEDIVTANRLKATISILSNRGDGTFVSLPDIAGGSNPAFITASDLDGNGTLDALVHCGGTGSSSYFRVNSLGGCAATPGCLKGDMNQDGLVNGRDIQLFVRTLLNPGAATGWERCAADIDNNLVNSISYDLPRFVCLLLTGSSNCSSGCTAGGGAEIIQFVDCNANGIQDSQDIASGYSLDCNSNGTPDECEGDCNGNGVPDDCDLTSGYSQDCNHDEYPDECDLMLPPPWGALDCNGNNVPDSCDIASGYSQDANSNGIPDECEGGLGGGMYAAQGAGGESGDSPTGGEGYNWDEEAAWEAFYDWAFEQSWGPTSEYTGLEQTQRMLDKLGELGLPQEAQVWNP